MRVQKRCARTDGQMRGCVCALQERVCVPHRFSVSARKGARLHKCVHGTAVCPRKGDRGGGVGGVWRSVDGVSACTRLVVWLNEVLGRFQSPPLYPEINMM